MLARRIFLSTIDPNLQNTLLGCKTANEIWVRIISQHLKNAAENKYVVMQRFYHYKFQVGKEINYLINCIDSITDPIQSLLSFESGHDAMSHTSAIENLAEQLSNMGQPISDAQLITKIICILQPSYRGFITAWAIGSVEEQKHIDAYVVDGFFFITFCFTTSADL